MSSKASVPTVDRTIAAVFDAVAGIGELADLIRNDNYDSGIALDVQADRLSELASQAERLSGDFESLYSALNS